MWPLVCFIFIQIAKVQLWQYEEILQRFIEVSWEPAAADIAASLILSRRFNTATPMGLMPAGHLL